MVLQDGFITDKGDDTHSNSEFEDDNLGFPIMYKRKNIRKKKNLKTMDEVGKRLLSRSKTTFLVLLNVLLKTDAPLILLFKWK